MVSSKGKANRIRGRGGWLRGGSDKEQINVVRIGVGLDLRDEEQDGTFQGLF